jgi:hypothetical protein
MRQMKIELSKKSEGFKEALEAYIKKNSVSGMLVEFGTPDLTPYKDAKRRGWRLRQVNPANVCAVLKSPVYNESDNTYIFTVHPDGGRRDVLDAYNEELMIGTRLMKDKNGKVIEIMQIDFILANNHVDIEHEEIGKKKK